jgi:hypothetical protein
MAATVTMGVAPLLFVQLTYHRQAYAASIVSGWFWMGIIPAVIIAYYLLYSASFSREGKSPHRGTFLFLAMIFMLYVAYVYSSVFSMAEQPQQIKELYAANQSGTVLNPYVGDYLFRWLHMILGALTVGGFFVGWIGKDHDQTYGAGRSFFLWGMVAASIAGLAYIFTLGDYLVPYMRTPAVWALLVGIILSAGSLHFFFKKKFMPAAVMLLVSIITMVINRHYVRAVRLHEYWDPADITVRPDWSIFLVFLVCFVLAVALVWYMLHIFIQDRKRIAGT